MAITRREFLKITALNMGGLCLGSLGICGCSSNGVSNTPFAPAGSYRLSNGKVILDLLKVSDLNEPGSAVKFLLTDDKGVERKIIVLHTKQNAESNLTKQSNNAAFCSSNSLRNGLFYNDTYGELHSNQAHLAFEDRCTHNGKELNYLAEENVLACSGLRSKFDLAGNVVERPAENPLQQYDVLLAGEELFISI